MRDSKERLRLCDVVGSKSSKYLKDQSDEQELGHVPINGVRAESMIVATQFTPMFTLGPSTLEGQVHRRSRLLSLLGVVMSDAEELRGRDD